MPIPVGYVIEPLAARFAAKIRVSHDGCWLWTGFIDKAGYGRIRQGGRSSPVLYAHRYAYEHSNPPIPDGMTIDHLCRVRHCVNPAHLEVVTRRENSMRGASPMILVHLSGRCMRGHERNTENTYVRKDGRAQCKACRRERRTADREAVPIARY